METKDTMVEKQLLLRGIKGENVLNTFKKVPRHLFVDKRFAPDAYSDYPLPIGEGQTISQPYIVAKMTELLDIGKNMKVLEVGTGSGYQTAILAELVQKVFTVERFDTLINNARKVLTEIGYHNIEYKIGDGTLGWAENSPYERIIVTAAAPEIPQALFEQLREFGKMVLPVGERERQRLVVAQKKSSKKVVSYSDGCIFVPLIGAHGFDASLK